MSGRDFAGEIIEEPRVSSRFKAGDTVSFASGVEDLAEVSGYGNIDRL